MPKQFIYLDLGWTLEDETQSQIDRAQQTVNCLKKYNIETTYEEILKWQEDGASLFVPSVFNYALQKLNLEDSILKEIKETVQWNKKLLSLYPDTIDVLDKLSKKHALGIIANQSTGTTKRLKKYGIYNYFDVVLASDEIKISKPDKRIFELAINKCGYSPENIWMVGDRIDNDIVPAKKMEWKTIRILHGYNRYQKARNKDEEADYTIKELSEMLKIFLE